MTADVVTRLLNSTAQLPSLLQPSQSMGLCSRLVWPEAAVEIHIKTNIVITGTSGQGKKKMKEINNPYFEISSFPA